MSADSVKLYSSGTLVSSSSSMDNQILAAAGNNLMYISSGGTATDTTITSGGTMRVFSGGIAENPHISSGGYVYFYGGVASNVFMEVGAYTNSFSYLSGSDTTFYKMNGNGAYHSGDLSDITYSGRLYITDGIEMSNVTYSGCLIYDGGTLTNISGTSLSLGSSTVVSSATVDVLAMRSGGILYDAEIGNGTFSSGAVVSNLTVSGGHTYIYEASCNCLTYLDYRCILNTHQIKNKTVYSF